MIEIVTPLVTLQGEDHPQSCPESIGNPTKEDVSGRTYPKDLVANGSGTVQERLRLDLFRFMMDKGSGCVKRC